MARVVAIEAHEIPERPPLSLAAGDVVAVGRRDDDWPAVVGETIEVVARDDESGWLWYRTADDREGWVPRRTLQSTDDRETADRDPPNEVV